MKHDESNDVRILRRLGCQFSNHTDTKGTVKCIAVNSNLGIKSLGRVDFLVNHCGYIRVSNINSYSPTITGENKSYRDIKKQKKTPKLTDKTKTKKKK